MNTTPYTHHTSGV